MQQWIVLTWASLLLVTHLHAAEAPVAAKPPCCEFCTVPVAASKPLEYKPELIAEIVKAAKESGSIERGAAVFTNAKFACISCHQIGKLGGAVGPELTTVSDTLTPEAIAESILWPARVIKQGYAAVTIITDDGKSRTGYIEAETKDEIQLRDPATKELIKIATQTIEERVNAGTLMPNGIAEAMTADQRRDVVRLLMECRKSGKPLADLLATAHTVAKFQYEAAPLDPAEWRHHKHPVNRDRVYEFYQKEALHFKQHPGQLLPPDPGLDGGKYGHWGNQNEQTWANDAWGKMDLGSLQSCVFRSKEQNLVVPRAMCVNLGEYSVCFNADTLRYEAFWKGAFLRISTTRSGFLDALQPAGELQPLPEQTQPTGDKRFLGLLRSANRVTFIYQINGVTWHDTPVEIEGELVRDLYQVTDTITPEPMAQWPQTFTLSGKRGTESPYALDTIPLPIENPWRSILAFGGHDFLSDGSAMLCTMQGDVWHVTGLDDQLQQVRWRRYASGLHHALGLVVHQDQVYVLGRDQITRLHDTNLDGEADYYQRFSAAYITSPAGHDFICGLERDRDGQFYTASGNQGLLRITADGKQCYVLAKGLRNPDGLGLLTDGTLTIPSTEGNWVPASMICAVPKTTKTPVYFGYGGPKPDRPELPLVYLPRSLDNSSGGQLSVTSDRWGPLQGLTLTTSFGTGNYFLMLRDGPQGAIVPLPGDFDSGVHRARFHPRDGQLYLSGMGGWGTYTPDMGCFQRVRYTGQPVQLPNAIHVHQNGVMISFTQPVDRKLVTDVAGHFAQAWNYRYSTAYGSPEFSPSHYGTPGHDRWQIKSVHVVNERTIFVELPELQPVNQLHLQLQVNPGRAQNLFVTVHELGKPFDKLPGYQPVAKQLAAHPIDVDLATATKTVPNPYRKSIPAARAITIEAGKYLSFVQRSLTVKAGEPLKITFNNPDVVPHNWVLIQPGKLEEIGQASNKLVADPEAVARHYIPTSDNVLAYTDITQAGQESTIFIQAPTKPGRYPYLCTFPGHWMVMNGTLIVEGVGAE